MTFNIEGHLELCVYSIPREKEFKKRDVKSLVLLLSEFQNFEMGEAIFCYICTANVGVRVTLFTLETQKSNIKSQVLEN